MFGSDVPQELLLTTRPKAKSRNAFSNQLATDIKLDKAQISKIIQSRGLLGALLSILAGPKNHFFPLGLIRAPAATDVGIQKDFFFRVNENADNFK